MTEYRWRRPAWTHSESGLTFPTDRLSNLSLSSSLTYLQIKEKAIAVRSLFADSAVNVPPSSGLASLIDDAIRMSDWWLTGEAPNISPQMLFRGVQMVRVADAILPLLEVKDRSRYLRLLTVGSLSPFKRVRSQSKDFLWELEAWAYLKRRSIYAVLAEPPDIVVESGADRIGVACKKFYSTRHVQNVLSTGVAQIEKAFEIGIIAVNLDDLLPADTVMRAPTQDAMGEMLTNFNMTFLRNHERHFRKYLSSGRLIAALVSTGGIAEIYQETPRLNTARQSTVWAIPGLSEQKTRVLHRFRDRLML
jgi:hypothetical protein